jgi:peroxiredoxin
MSIQVGDRIPDVKLAHATAEGPKPVSTGELFAGKKVALFAVPGAFTPTCNNTHMPGYLVQADKLKEKGADLIVCTSVNDPFVMASWAKASNAADHIYMLADGNGDFAEALGLVLDLTHVGFGKRSKRYGAVVEDGVVRYLGVEPAGEVGVSSADAVLEAL